MAYEITANGFFSAMYDELKPGMVALLNAVEMADGDFTHSTKTEQKLCTLALSKGFIRVI